MWKAKQALQIMAGRPSDLTIEQQSARLECCQSCEMRVGNECHSIGQQLTVHALRKKNRCPLGKWDPQTEKRPKPKPAPWQPAPNESMRTLAVLTCFWNPERYARPLENWHQFRRGIESAGLDLLTLELVLDDDQAQLSGDGVEHIHGTRAANLLWQKERLLNLAAARCDGVDAIAWIDADILFLNSNWAADTLRALEQNAVVQLYSKAYNRMPSGDLVPLKNSCGWYYHHRPEDTVKFQFSHPGFAWAARASWWRAVGGLYPNCITGSGDAMMMEGISGGRPFYTDLIAECGGWSRDLADWTARARQATGGAFGYVDGPIVHCFHGAKKNRKYTERQHYLIDADFDPATDVMIDSAGLLAWTDLAKSHKRKMVDQVGGYFAERREDD